MSITSEVVTRAGSVIGFNQTSDWICGEPYTEVFYNGAKIGTIVDGDVNVQDAFQLEVEEAFRLL